MEWIKEALLHYFTWWNGANFNTRFYTKRHGQLVGYDEPATPITGGRASIRRSGLSGAG